jgi:hypothetical protein
LFGQLQVGGGVGQDMVFPYQPLEPSLQGGEVLFLHPQRQRLAVGLTVIEQVALVAFQHGTGDDFRVANAAFVRPGDETAKRLPSGTDSVLAVARHQHPFKMLSQVTGERVVCQGIDGILGGHHGRFDGCGLAYLDPLPQARHVSFRRLRLSLS